jgi:hypothetical protein
MCTVMCSVLEAIFGFTKTQVCNWSTVISFVYELAKMCETISEMFIFKSMNALGKLINYILSIFPLTWLSTIGVLFFDIEPNIIYIKTVSSQKPLAIFQPL